jgi:hypothetical protein
MLGNNTPIFVKKRCYLFLIKPNRFIFKMRFNFDLSIFGLANDKWNGFHLELLKEAGGGNYFDELLARIRDIRSSEKVFWRKVLEIYATSIDYDPKTEQSVKVFETIQNKMHWASHGETKKYLIA